MSSLVSGAATQLRVIHALALRETRTRYGQHSLGYVWALVEPLLWVGMFVAMYELVGRQVPDGMAVLPFLITGFVPFGLFRKTAEQASQAVNANKGMLFYPHVKPLDLVFARTTLEAPTYLVVFTIVMGTYTVVSGARLDIDNVLVLLSAFALLALLGMTFGLLMCAVAVIFPTMDRIRSTLLRPLFWTSALFYTANELPTQAREILWYNPVLHCIELSRDGWFPAYHSTVASPWYVIAWILGLALLGLTMERAVRKRLELS